MIKVEKLGAEAGSNYVFDQVLAAFIIAAGVYWLVKRRSSIDVTNSKD